MDPRGKKKTPSKGLAGPGGLAEVLASRRREMEATNKAIEKAISGKSLNKSEESRLASLAASMFGAGIVRTTGGGITRAVRGSRGLFAQRVEALKDLGPSGGRLNTVLSKDVRPVGKIVQSPPANRPGQAMLVVKGGRRFVGREAPEYVREPSFKHEAAIRRQRAGGERLSAAELAVEEGRMLKLTPRHRTRLRLQIKRDKILEDIRNLPPKSVRFGRMKAKYDELTDAINELEY